jgi:hypothetical protein
MLLTEKNRHARCSDRRSGRWLLMSPLLTHPEDCPAAAGRVVGLNSPNIKVGDKDRSTGQDLLYIKTNKVIIDP